jgi:AcrR family transcriptional regulator
MDRGAVPPVRFSLLSRGGLVSVGTSRARPSPASTRRRPPGSPMNRSHPPETPRVRMLAAAEQLVCARGADQLTVTAVTVAARVSRTTFYGTFADREDCLLGVFDEVADRIRAAMLAAYARESSWLAGIRASLCELLVLLDAEPKLARFLIVGGVSGDSARVVRRRRVLEDLARSLEADSPNIAAREAAVPFGSEALVSGAASIVHSRLVEEPVPALGDLAGPLMAMLVLPFVGEGVARSELARRSASAGGAPTAPRSRGPASRVSAVRVTARTARVLSVIARSPGISNRSVAKLAGDIDEGQISRLLARLSTVGLIANTRPGYHRGGCNAWRLTGAGAELLADRARREH